MHGHDHIQPGAVPAQRRGPPQPQQRITGPRYPGLAQTRRRAMDQYRGHMAPAFADHMVQRRCDQALQDGGLCKGRGQFQQSRCQLQQGFRRQTGKGKCLEIIRNDGADFDDPTHVKMTTKGPAWQVGMQSGHGRRAFGPGLPQICQSAPDHRQILVCNRSPDGCIHRDDIVGLVRANIQTKRGKGLLFRFKGPNGPASIGQRKGNGKAAETGPDVQCSAGRGKRSGSQCPLVNHLQSPQAVVAQLLAGRHLQLKHGPKCAE